MSAAGEGLHRLLDEDGDAPPGLNDDERWLARHTAALAAVLPAQIHAYRELAAAADGGDDVRDAAIAEAQTGAIILQSLHRRPHVLIAAEQTPVRPALAIEALNQIFYSLTLLAGPPSDENVEARLTGEEFEELAADPELTAWIEQVGAAGQ